MPLLLFTLTACTSPLSDSYWQGHESFRAGESSDALRQRIVADARGESHAAADEDPRSPAELDLPEEPTVEDYIALALSRNPQLTAARRRVERLAERIPQATSLDDPMAQVAPLGEMAQTAAGEVQVMAGASQRLPFPGKRAARGDIAAGDVHAARAERDRTEQRIAAQVRRAYWSYYDAHRALEVTDAQTEVLDRLQDAAVNLYEAGDAQRADVLRAQTEISRLEGDRIALRERRDNAAAMLNQLMHRASDAPLPEPAPIDPDTLNADHEPLLAEAIAQHPELAGIRARIDQSHAQRRLAELNRWPDLTLSVNYAAVSRDGLAMSATGDDQWWLGFGVNLPIWTDRLDAAEREAMLGTLEQTARLAATENRVRFEVREAWLKVQAQQRLITLFDQSILPDARRTVAAASDTYRAGEGDFLNVIDNWRKQVDLERMYHRAVADRQRALADLHEALGRTPGNQSARPTDPDTIHTNTREVDHD